jgi:hypothetical protein
VAERRIKNEYTADYLLIGIASSLKEYKFCFHLSQLLALEFRKLNDLVFESGDRTRKTQFSVFKAGGEDDRNQFTVFTNKNLDEVLLTEVANFDFIIQIQGKYEADETKNLIAGIKQFSEVMMTAEIPLKKIKNKDRLVYEEERPSHKLFSTKKFK